MRKLWVGLIAASLGLATPAMAQTPGSADPLGLITSGMVVPYIGGGSNQSYLEVYSPVGSGQVHMFFFDSTCVRRGPSVNIEMTPNDVEFLRLDDKTPLAPSGLIAAAGVDASGFNLIPTNFPPGVHAHVLWVDLDTAILRTLEPIALSTRDNDLTATPTATWSPLRTGAAFFAPLETNDISTTLYLVCPNRNIQGSPSGGALPIGAGFPAIDPAFRVAGQTTPLRVRVYDDEEGFLRDVTSNCNCLTIRPVTDIDGVYADSVEAPFGTYTEVEGFGTITITPPVCSPLAQEPLINPPSPNPGNPCPLIGDPPTAQQVLVTPAVTAGTPFSFTGYRAITFGPVDIFSRLHNGHRCDLAAGDASCTTPANRR